MGKDDDAVPAEYPYSWGPKSSSTLQEFLAKYKPSMVQNDGTKPWLWVCKTEDPHQDRNASPAIDEATKYLADVSERVQKIQTDDSIPVRANKKKGLKSKKELREEVQNEATGKLKEISVKHGYVSGKWLVFAPSDKVNMIWGSVANSLVSGPLSSTSAYLAKVATSPQDDSANYSHLICIYMPDAYDQASVTEVMRVLLRNHGLNLTGVKTNLYTSIGLDSKHPSGVSSTAWKNTALMKDSEIKQLKDEYFSELNSAKPAAPESTATKSTTIAPTKTKPKLKKKGADDPFASDDEGEKGDSAKPEKAAMPTATKSKKPVPKKKVVADAFESEEDDDGGEDVRKAEVKAKKGVVEKKRKVEDSDAESEDDAPKKKRGRARA